MPADQIEKLTKIAKKFPKHIAILAVLSIGIFLFFYMQWNKLHELEKELYQKEVVLKQKELELAAKFKRDNTFNAALEKFNSKFGDVDLSREIECDNAYMDRYREAKTALDALEGMAKETGKYRLYENFFREKRGNIHTWSNSCNKKGTTGL
jgi:hypothetical protein